MPKWDFNKVASNFIEITLWHGCSPANLLPIFKASFPNDSSGGLLLHVILWGVSALLQFSTVVVTVN